MYQVVPGPEACCAADTVMEVAIDCDCAGIPLSVIFAVKVEVPFPVGVPEMLPVLAARVRPLAASPTRWTRYRPAYRR